ncbi:DUF3159 domain-containing protein [Kibdelosporangium philippinense]|uniref:DUF3159 domain-containing protein n=1 Tax=Kibdelosporangium philippinense TaxID=211113 RepID=A0ABS8ZPJ6_9PSEU|nr:DUF3159 domain-containing protein [Kibdelosporangium philippinense]MCE7009679.1 DUF3159 domain-containing protein [Kibdelosporangium philippinense]
MTEEKPTPEQDTTEADQTEKPMPTLWEQMGGLVGFVSASVPVAVFVIVNIATSMGPAIWSAVGAAVLIAVIRIIRKEQLMPAISGIFGVAIAAFIAYRVGEAKGFFLYGIWVSGALGSAFLISMFVRWPLVGVIWSTLNGHGFGWRADKKSRMYYDIATAVWTLVFASRVVVQQWLYNTDETTLLGIARLAMGYPLTIIAFLVAIWAVRKVNHRDKIREEAAKQEAVVDAEIERELRAKYDTPAQESP